MWCTSSCPPMPEPPSPRQSSSFDDDLGGPIFPVFDNDTVPFLFLLALDKDLDLEFKFDPDPDPDFELPFVPLDREAEALLSRFESPAVP